MVGLFRAPGVAFITLATILGFLVTISLPLVHTFDVVRVRFNGVGTANSVQSVRWGIWGWCEENSGRSDFKCHHTGLAYSITLDSPKGRGSPTATIGGSYTRGLILHPIAFVSCVVTLLLGFSEQLSLSIATVLMSCVSALVTAIALAIDIVLHMRVHHQSDDLKGTKDNTNFGPAYWMTLVQLVLLLLAGGTIYFGHRRERMEQYGPSASYPMVSSKPWWSRYNRGD